MKKNIYIFLVMFLFSIFTFNLYSYSNKINLDNIELQNIEGNKIKFSDLKGNNIYLEFWASWCPICIEDLPHIDELSEKNDKNFQVYTVVSPGKNGEKNIEDFKKWYKNLGYKNIRILIDKKGELIKLFNVRAYPTSLIINKNLEIKNAIVGSIGNEKIIEVFKSNLN